MAEIKVGDVVELKSGGPDMTVILITAKDLNVKCAWFDGNELKYADFSEDSLKKVKEYK